MDIKELEKKVYSRIDTVEFCQLVTEYKERLDLSITEEARNHHLDYVKSLLPMRTFLSNCKYDEVEVYTKNSLQDDQKIDAVAFKDNCEITVQTTLAFKDIESSAFSTSIIREKGWANDALHFKDKAKMKAHFKKRYPTIEWNENHINRYEKYGYYIEISDGKIYYSYSGEKCFTETKDEICNQVELAIQKKLKKGLKAEILLIGINDSAVRTDQSKTELKMLLYNKVAAINNVDFYIYVVGITKESRECFFQKISVAAATD